MAKVNSHRDLIVWRKAMELALLAYKISGTFPKAEEYRLVAQVTRAAASVPANIAEGHARGTRKEYAKFLSIARGSLAETETFLLLAKELKYATEPQVAPALSLIVEISKMLTAIRTKLLASA